MEYGISFFLSFFYIEHDISQNNRGEGAGAGAGGRYLSIKLNETF